MENKSVAELEENELQDVAGGKFEREAHFSPVQPEENKGVLRDAADAAGVKIVVYNGEP